jgi:hypothetical protein
VSASKKHRFFERRQTRISLTLPRRVSRLPCLGAAATRLETSDVAFSHRGIPDVEAFEPLRGDPRSCSRPIRWLGTEFFPLALARRASRQRTHGDVPSELAPQPAEAVCATSERHVESTSATRIFSFQRREPTSCAATEETQTFDPISPMSRPFCGGRHAFGGRHR